MLNANKMRCIDDDDVVQMIAQLLFVSIVSVCRARAHTLAARMKKWTEKEKQHTPHTHLVTEECFGIIKNFSERVKVYLCLIYGWNVRWMVFHELCVFYGFPLFHLHQLMQSPRDAHSVEIIQTNGF